MTMSGTVHWWTAEAGFGAAVDWDAHAVTVVGVAGQAQREAARLAIRAALHAALAEAHRVAPQDVALHAAPGAAPFAVIGGARRIALSISHDGALSLAAFAVAGPVGIDVMQIVPVPDWQAVARDYLGPAVVASLAALPDGARDAAFARAWSAREARFKALGWALREWDGGDDAALRACRCVALEVPDGYVATVSS